ncbi:hypothetical protein BpHYR1_038220 [Brachionus plicatilis]|uniref:Uncharacterized protein n=1 Tax=Brachionus plicatilis TaxID=10195 RepID=A0A3M7SI94_BRAPC|nr:hypothetical protein BpHYR1_038220 [Brachionus plicatilis]
MKILLEKKNGVRRVRISFPKHYWKLVRPFNNEWLKVETQSIIEADQKDNDDNMMPKTPGYKPSHLNYVMSQTSPQDLKTPVLEDCLVSLLNSSTTECSSLIDQSSSKVVQQTSSQNSYEEN